MAKKSVSDVQFTGSDGVVYRIPAAVLTQFAVPKSDAWTVPWSEGSAPRKGFAKDGVFQYAGGASSVVEQDPLTLLESVKVCVDSGISADVERVLRKHRDTAAFIPSSAAEAFNKAARKAAKGKKAPRLPADDMVVKVSVLALFRFLDKSVQLGAYNDLIKVAEEHRGINILLPTSLVNDIMHLMMTTHSKKPLKGAQAKPFLVMMMSKAPHPGGPDGGPPDGGGGGPGPRGSCVETGDTGMMGCPA